MKFKLFVVLTVICCQKILQITAAPSPPFKPSQRLPGPLDSSDQRAIAFLEEEATREKRGSASGSGDILNHIKKSIGQGIKNKIGQLAKSSAGASAYFSKSSSAHHHGPPDHGHGHYPHPPPHYYPPHGHGHEYHHDEKPFDIFDMKKSVLFTLLQAVKAIKGGVIAIKGQLIKGGGHLLTAKGKLIRGGGEVLTSLGKNLALSAFHFMPESHEEEEGVIHEAPHEEEHPSTGYGYSAPSGPSHDVPPSGYGHPGYYHNSVYDGKPSAQQHDGLIILRKIPKHLRHPSDNDGDHTNDEHHQQQQQHEDHHHHSHGAYEHHHHEQDQQDVQESQKTPAFRPLSDGIVPKMKNLVTSVFQSSAYPTRHSLPSKQYDNTPSQSQYQTNAFKQTSAKVQPLIQAHTQAVQPQQANIGSLVNYLDYIRGVQKKGDKGDKNNDKDSKLEKNIGVKVKNPVYVTPAPQIPDKPKTEKQKSHLQSQNTQDAAKLKQEQQLLEQQLQQLASLQNLQQQLSIINPYAAQTAQQAQGQGQGQGEIQEQIYQNQPQPPQQFVEQTQTQNLNQIYHGELDAQNYPVVVNLQGLPGFQQEVPQNINLANMLTQYQIVPDIPQLQTQTQFQPQPIHQQLYEDPMEESESSNIQTHTFLIHVPDDDEVEEDRSLRATPRPKPKSKRHLRPQQILNFQRPTATKPKKLSQLQQVQLMQQQLHYQHNPYHNLEHNLQPKQSKASKQNKRSPTLDVIRSISFELGPDGLIKTNH